MFILNLLFSVYFCISFILILLIMFQKSQKLFSQSSFNKNNNIKFDYNLTIFFKLTLLFLFLFFIFTIIINYYINLYK